MGTSEFNSGCNIAEVGERPNTLTLFFFTKIRKSLHATKTGVKHLLIRDVNRQTLPAWVVAALRPHLG